MDQLKTATATATARESGRTTIAKLESFQVKGSAKTRPFPTFDSPRAHFSLHVDELKKGRRRMLAHWQDKTSMSSTDSAAGKGYIVDPHRYSIANENAASDQCSFAPGQSTWTRVRYTPLHKQPIFLFLRWPGTSIPVARGTSCFVPCLLGPPFPALDAHFHWLTSRLSPLARPPSPARFPRPSSSFPRSPGHQSTANVGASPLVPSCVGCPWWEGRRRLHVFLKFDNCPVQPHDASGQPTSSLLTWFSCWGPDVPPTFPCSLLPQSPSFSGSRGTK